MFLAWPGCSVMSLLRPDRKLGLNPLLQLRNQPLPALRPSPVVWQKFSTDIWGANIGVKGDP